MAVAVVMAAAVAAAAMVTAASSISKATEAAHRASEHPGDPAHASLAGNLAIGPRTAKQTP
jgi:hypothetical protein